MNEVKVLQRLQHHNIVSYRDSFVNAGGEKLSIIMEYAGGGDLASQIAGRRKQRGRFSVRCPVSMRRPLGSLECPCLQPANREVLGLTPATAGGGDP